MFGFFFTLDSDRYTFATAKQIFHNHEKDIPLIKEDTGYIADGYYGLIVFFPNIPTYEQLLPVLKSFSINIHNQKKFLKRKKTKQKSPTSHLFQ